MEQLLAHWFAQCCIFRSCGILDKRTVMDSWLDYCTKQQVTPCGWRAMRRYLSSLGLIVIRWDRIQGAKVL